MRLIAGGRFPRWPMAALCLAPLLLAACASTEGRWEHPTKAERTWERDEADCRQRAMDVIDRDFRERERSASNRSGLPAAQPSDVDRFAAKRRQASLVERCMTSQGYRRAAPEE